jgi:hypothetical protein
VLRRVGAQLETGRRVRWGRARAGGLHCPGRPPSTEASCCELGGGCHVSVRDLIPESAVVDGRHLVGGECLAVTAR